MAQGARAWGSKVCESVAGLRGQLQDCGIIAYRSARECAVTWGMHVGVESCENKRRSCVDCGRTMVIGRGEWLAATLEEVGLKSSMSGSCGCN